MRTRWIIAAVLVVIGAGWLAQGLGLAPGSGIMDGDVRWAIIGGVMLIAGLAIGWTAFKARSRV
jgi:hypothetical protein